MLSPVEIVARLPTENPQAATMVDRMLRLLAPDTVVSCTVQTGADGRPTRKYGAPPICKYRNKNEDGVSMAALALLLQDKIFVDTCKVFNEGLRGHPSSIVKYLLRVYSGFDNMEVLVNVDGNDGASSLQMIKHPHIKGINYDRPHVISGAQRTPEKEINVLMEAAPQGDGIRHLDVPATFSEIDQMPTTSNQFGQRQIDANCESDTTKHSKDIFRKIFPV
ncbi:flavone O-methyltransferase 1-like [Musa acuminata AAA Group]|uniref:flavone O-methyltransferase 1-like n=1 Tax=Musa acuminata AAA Group TaxID=214697 RepID=UPI0031E03BE8